MQFLTSQKNKFMKSALAIALFGLFGTAHALTPEQKEIQQLRAEVNALKAAVQQNPHVAAKPISMPPKHHEGQKGLAFQTKKGADVKVYGFVRADAVYKLDGADTTFNSIESAAAEGNSDDKLNTTVGSTRIGLEFTAPNTGHKVGGKIEGDFNGASNAKAFRIRHAYLTYDNWLIGQTWSTFQDLNFLPEIIDDDLQAGQGAHRTQMIRYETNVAPTTKVAVALEKNTNYERMPNFVGRVQQSFAGDKGIWSTRAFVTEARDKSLGTTDNSVAWGVGVGASYALNDKFRLMGDYNHIKGSNQHLLHTNDAATVYNGELALSEYDGVSLGVNYQLTPKVLGAFGVGALKYKDNDFAKATPDANETIKQGFVNIVYKPVAPISLGVEYIQGRSETFSGVEGKDQRIGLMASYDF